MINRSNPVYTSTNSDCSKTNEVQLCISYDESARIVSAEISNSSDKPYTQRFNSTCTEPNLVIDGQSVNRTLACGQSITDVTINPSESKNYKLAIPQTYSGSNIAVEAKWGSLSSNTLQIEY